MGSYHYIMFRNTLLILLGFLANGLEAQPLTRAKIETLSKERLPRALADFRTFLRMPNDGNYREQVQANFEWCKREYAAKGFEVSELPTEGMPLLLAVLKSTKKNARTVLFYTQIDGQPVDAGSWNQPNPFEPVIKELATDGTWHPLEWPTSNINPEWRVYARSASDSKGPAMMLMQAIDILQLQKITPEYTIKIIMDFQEEKGSPDLPEVVQKYNDKLKADFLVIMDGVRSVKNVPTLTFGARGIATITLKVFGPIGDAHSGQFGNYVPNPVFAAARLLASMKDEHGRVLIPGFYEGVILSDQEKKILNQVPDDPEEQGAALGIARPEEVGGTYQEALQYPTLNIRGIQAARVGKEARTIIPSEVTIEMDIRLVKETEGNHQVGLVKQFIIDQGFHLVDEAPTVLERSKYEKLASFRYTLGSTPFRTPYDSPLGVWLSSAIVRATGQAPIKLRTTGGSQPIAPFVNTLKVPAISVRIPNPGSNIHASDENIRVGNFLEGIQTCLSILTEPIR